MAIRTSSLALLFLAVWLMFGPGAWGFTHAQLGTVVQDAEMPTLMGGKAHLLTDAKVNVIFFFRPGQEFSQLALKELAGLEKELSGKSVHWVAVVSDREPTDAVKAELKESGLAMPVLIDVHDELYGRLGVAQVPIVGMCDEQHRLTAYESFRKVHYAAVVRARVRNLLKEISDDEMAAVLNPPIALTDSDDAASARRLKLADILLKAKSYDKALENVDASLERKPSAPALALRGDIFAAQGKCAEATAAYQQALQLDPQNARALNGINACKQK
ncbi:MAG TPA: tetratricopeptide repeat protein [Terriglobales bacterium]